MNTFRKSLTRRSFCRVSGALAASALLSSRAFAETSSRRLRVGQVGVGNQGDGNLKALLRLPNVEVVALCDVDREALAKAKSLVPGAATFADYRRMLEAAGSNIDAVLVSTPDHMHAPVAMAAMDLGKHVYCEKPLAHNVWENRLLRLKAEETGLVTQLGIQVSASIGQRMTVQYIQRGLIGKVREVHVWSNKRWGRDDGEPPAPAEPPPSLDWNLWLGVAERRPFADGHYLRGEWRRVLDFGTGTLGDMGVHIFDTPYRALELGAPRWARSACRPFNGLYHPESVLVEYAFPPTPYTTEDLSWFWYDGGYAPTGGAIPGVELPAGTQLPEQGCLFVGQDGMLLMPHLEGPRTFPADLIRSMPRPELAPIDHHGEWASAALGLGKTGSPFSYGGPLCEVLQLGVLANRYPGRALEWDAINLEVTNIREANEHLKREYRAF